MSIGAVAEPATNMTTASGQSPSTSRAGTSSTNIAVAASMSRRVSVERKTRLPNTMPASVEPEGEAAEDDAREPRLPVLLGVGDGDDLVGAEDDTGHDERGRDEEQAGAAHGEPTGTVRVRDDRRLRGAGREERQHARGEEQLGEQEAGLGEPQRRHEDREHRAEDERRLVGDLLERHRGVQAVGLVPEDVRPPGPRHRPGLGQHGRQAVEEEERPGRGVAPRQHGHGDPAHRREQHERQGDAPLAVLVDEPAEHRARHGEHGQPHGRDGAGEPEGAPALAEHDDDGDTEHRPARARQGRPRDEAGGAGDAEERGVGGQHGGLRVGKGWVTIVGATGAGGQRGGGGQGAGLSGRRTRR